MAVIMPTAAMLPLEDKRRSVRRRLTPAPERLSDVLADVLADVLTSVPVLSVALIGLLLQ
jgi:hypothetical protein